MRLLKGITTTIRRSSHTRSIKAALINLQRLVESAWLLHIKKSDKVICMPQYIICTSRGGRSRLTFTDQVSLKSRVAQYCRLRNARLVQYSPLTVFGLFHDIAPALSP